MTFLEYFKKKSFNKRLIDSYGKYKVFLVDDEAVRDFSQEAEEFGEFAIHWYFPKLIPENEIWIARSIKKSEIPFLLANALFQLKHGSSDKIYKLATKKEQRIRELVDGLKLHPEKINEKANKKVYVKKYGNIGDVEIWMVDAEIVRDIYKTEFMEGGHWRVYSWIPNGEIWIENGLKEAEIPFIILHEFTEMILMKDKKLSYDKAHDIASKVEFNKREGKFDKSDVLSMKESDVNLKV